MEEQNNKQKEEQEGPNNIEQNIEGFDSAISLGDIKLQALGVPIDRLADIALWLLQQTEIKEYLGVIAKKAAAQGGYVG